MEYERTNDPYGLARHWNALDLNLNYIGGDKYTLPKHWGNDTIVVDLSATGKEQNQILKSIVGQLVSMYDALCYGIEIASQQQHKT